MSITTYAELQTAVGNWLNRTDLTSRIPEFIALAESRISRDLELDTLNKRVTSSTVAAQEFYTLPTDMLSVIAITVDSSPVQTLSFLSQDLMAEKYPDRPSGLPEAFGVVGEGLQLMPVPGAVYTMTMRYKAMVPALTNSNTTNNILTRFPDVYLYSSLLEAEPFLRNDARIQTWMTLYDRAVTTANRSAFQVPPSNLVVRVA